MQSFQRKPDRAAGLSTPVQRVSIARTSVVDNRPTAIAQRKLNERISAFSAVLQRKSPVIQMVKETAEANWRTMGQYNNGSAAREVIDAFTQANYVAGSALGERIVRLMDRNGYGANKFAHGKGDNNSGKQGDTDLKIQECKNFLINWANKNPNVKEKQEKKYVEPRRKDRDDDDKGGGGPKGKEKIDERYYKASWNGGFPAW